MDMLPEHRYLGLSEGARSLVVAGAAIGLGGLGVLTPLAHLLLPASASVSPELVLAWSFSATCTAGATAALVALRYWKARADWSERLRRLVNASFFLPFQDCMHQPARGKSAFAVFGSLSNKEPGIYSCHYFFVAMVVTSRIWPTVRLSTENCRPH